MKRPSFQFYPADWRKEPSLSTCSLAARGLWVELMCVMHDSEIYGVLSLNGAPMSMQQIARTVGESVTIVTRLVDELRNAGVYSINESGCIFSRRMVRDERLRGVRASAGKMGGNPNLLGDLVKQNQEQESDINRKSQKKIKNISKNSEGDGDTGKDSLSNEINGSTGNLLNQNSNQILTPSSSSSVNPISSSLRSEEIPPSGKKKITFSAWLAGIRQSGEKPITPYRPVWEAAATLGIPDDWIEMAWIRFADRYTNSPDNSKKRYIDWRRAFLNAVTDNWLGLWYFRDGKPNLTTAGIQADLLTREVA